MLGLPSYLHANRVDPPTQYVMTNIKYQGFPILTCEMAYEEEQQEEKVWEKKKRTRERVSSLMGQYLLKGYRMLNVNCAECGNLDGCLFDILNRQNTTQGSGQAMNSTQVPSPTSLSAVTTTTLSVRSMVPIVCTGQTRDTVKLTTTPAEHDIMTMCTDTKRTGMRTNPAITHSTMPKQPSDTSHLNRVEPSSPAKLVPTLQLVSHTEASVQCQMALISKLKWCTSELEKTQSVEQATLLCRLITATGEALKTLQELPSPSTTDLRLDAA